MLLGFGVAITGIFTSPLGLYITTILMSIGFHYLETLNQSLSLQWLSKKEAPIVLGKLSAVKSFTGLIVLGLIYLMMKFYQTEYQFVYLFFGIGSFIIGIFAWVFFNHFEEKVQQKKTLTLKKQYWLFYALTFLAGARRQIFVVFAGFLLVDKFGVDIHNIVLLLVINAVLNIIVAPKIGKFIALYGERLSLRYEYIGLTLIFLSYAFVNNLYLAFTLFVLDNLLFSMGIALKTYFQKIADPRDIASASAVSFAINHIAAVFLPVFLGMVWLYSYELVFIIGVGIVIISLFLSFLVPKNSIQEFEKILKKLKTDGLDFTHKV